MWGLADCDNFYCSCERVFRPELNGRPVVVLSNNDGCVIARSREVKAMGVKMGMPYYQLLEQYAGRGITAFSSNYTLYGDLSARIMAILREEAPAVVQYSIDEAFLDLRGLEGADLKQWGERVSAKIAQWTGMPVSIGIAPTKTLAKMASKFAKQYAGYRKCCVMATERQRERALELFPLADVWGIGRATLGKLEQQGVTTAAGFAKMQRYWVRKRFHVTGERTWAELRGEDCIDVDDMNTDRKSIVTSRSFPGMLTSLDDVATHVANYAARCGEKLRRQHSACNILAVWVSTNSFRTDLPQYHNSAQVRFANPTASLHELVAAARQALGVVWRPGYHYKRAGVMVMGLCPDSPFQPDLFCFDARRHSKLAGLSQVIDQINARLGSETVVLGAQQYRDVGADGKHVRFDRAIKRALKSPNYTTSVDDFRVGGPLRRSEVTI